MIAAVVPAPLRVRVVLLHHGVEARVADARRTVSVVAQGMEKYGPVQRSEISEQPAECRLGLPALAGRLVRQWRLERRWSRHLRVSPRWFLSVGLLGLRLLQLTAAGRRRSAQERGCIELALSAKHALAWRSALEDGIDVLVVLEDDARADEYTVERIDHVIAVAQQGAGLAQTYVDLAGGLDHSDLRLTRVADSSTPGVVRLSRAATNTTCAYLVGSGAIRGLAETTIRHPEYCRLPADWLLNRCFLDVELQCLHARPHALAHGSFTGAVDSTIR